MENEDKMPSQNGSNGSENSPFGTRLVPDYVNGDSLTQTEKIEDVWITSELYGRVPREANIDEDLSALRNIAAMVQTTPAEILTTLM
jgi:hypothetical protein